jgi:hypothetical protein
MRSLVAELQKLAITFEEYKRLHPKTRKKPNDPLFTKDQNSSDTTPRDEVIEVSPEILESMKNRLNPETKAEKPKSRKKSPSAHDHPAIVAFTPKLETSPYQKTMSFDDFKKNSSQMKSDDFAWHLINSDFVKDDSDEIRAIFYNHMGVADYYAMTLLNPHVSKETKDETASWILDKSGVSFVASKKIKDLIRACAEKGIISKSVVEYETDLESSAKKRDEIGNMSSDQIKKLPKKDIQEHFKDICRNENTPSEMLLGFLSDKEVSSGIKHIQNGYLETSGYMVNVAKRKGEIEKALHVLQNPNLPFDKLKVLEKVMDEFAAAENHKGGELAQIFANHPDINKSENKTLRDKVLKIYQKKLFRVEDKESLEDPYRTRGSNLQIDHNLPGTFKLTEEEFMGVFNKMRSDGDKEYLYKHPSCPTSILKKALSSRSKEWRVQRAKNTVFDILMERKAISENDVIKTVKKNLNLDGEPELLKKFAKNAYVNGNQKNPIKRTITKSSEEDKRKIAEEMSKTSKHEEFDFEVVDVYDIDKEPHENFDEMSKKLGNVRSNLYHGTSYDGASGILSTGIRIGGEERTGSMFGQGFYIAEHSSKAVQYAGDNFSQHEGEGVVFVLQAALGNSIDMKYGRPQKDEMRWRSHTPEEKSMIEDYKKKTGKELKDRWHYSHDSVSAKAGTSLLYNEYVVKDASQVKINKVIIVKKKPKATA